MYCRGAVRCGAVCMQALPYCFFFVPWCLSIHLNASVSVTNIVTCPRTQRVSSLIRSIAVSIPFAALGHVWVQRRCVASKVVRHLHGRPARCWCCRCMHKFRYVVIFDVGLHRCFSVSTSSFLIDHAGFIICRRFTYAKQALFFYVSPRSPAIG